MCQLCAKSGRWHRAGKRSLDELCAGALPPGLERTVEAGPLNDPRHIAPTLLHFSMEQGKSHSAVPPRTIASCRRNPLQDLAASARQLLVRARAAFTIEGESVAHACDHIGDADGPWGVRGGHRFFQLDCSKRDQTIDLLQAASVQLSARSGHRDWSATETLAILLRASGRMLSVFFHQPEGHGDHRRPMESGRAPHHRRILPILLRLVG